MSSIFAVFLQNVFDRRVGTRAGRGRASGLPGSSPASSPIAPAARATGTATRRCARPPTAERDASSGPPRPSPRRCSGYGPHTRVPSGLPGSAHYMARRPLLRITAFVQAQVLRLVLARLRAFHDDAIQRGRPQQVVFTLAPAMQTESGPPRSSTSRLCHQFLLYAQLATAGGVRADAFAPDTFAPDALAAVSASGLVCFRFAVVCPWAIFWAILRCLARSALPPLLPSKRASLRQSSAACHFQ